MRDERCNTTHLVLTTITGLTSAGSWLGGAQSASVRENHGFILYTPLQDDCEGNIFFNKDFLRIKGCKTICSKNILSVLFSWTFLKYEKKYSPKTTRATLPFCGLINRKYTIKFWSFSSNMFLEIPKKMEDYFIYIESFGSSGPETETVLHDGFKPLYIQLSRRWTDCCLNVHRKTQIRYKEK